MSNRTEMMNSPLTVGPENNACLGLNEPFLI